MLLRFFVIDGRLCLGKTDFRQSVFWLSMGGLRPVHDSHIDAAGFRMEKCETSSYPS